VGNIWHIRKSRRSLQVCLCLYILLFLPLSYYFSATSRLLVQEKIAKQFQEKLKEAAEKIRVGSGLDPKSQMGPLVVKQQYDKVLGFVKTGIDEGATLLAGGKR
jgi:hypothetical protein